MALSSYWISQNRKDLAERAIVSKREKDAVRASKCMEVDSYHRQLALKSAKYRSLEEVQGLKTSKANDESRVKESQRFAEKERLEYRRQKLAHILAIENDQYMKELKAMQDGEREKDPWNIVKLKEQIEELQRRRKEGEQNMQKRYQHHLFSSSIKASKEKEEEELQREISEAWQQRKEELEKLSLEKQQKEKEKLQNLELEELKAKHEAREVEISQLEEQEKWSKLVEEKVNELNAADNEIQKLKAEKQILIQHLETLLSLQKRREAVRELQKKTFYKMQNMWQPKEKLRRILVEVQHSLDFDYKLLITMSAFNKSALEDTALALLDLDCVTDVKNKIEMQIAMEKEREVEIQQLYHEEATRVLNKRLEQWSLEALARDEIMTDLFKTLAKEINKKIEYNFEQEKKYLRLKEEWLKEIDEFNQKAKQTVKTLEEKKLCFLDRSKRLREELETLSTARSSRPSSSHGRYQMGTS
ncbi:trichoplein keratin filament-binding protein-like [Argiope bruennichi]|uniref:trichoplein keratin filament-binding protein-like n=1 Tax=Argiope bruennichi TaxID=94029 RepID=UPI0024944521|nr:trichoplein keratin filament-binding protein-like [Argiope bruennichi]